MISPRIGSAARSALAVMISATALHALAAPPLISVTNMQPVNAASVPDEAYVPGAASAFVYSEPTAYPTLPATGYRANIDFQIKNDELNYVRLDRYNSNIGAWSADLEGEQLLSMPETLLSFPLGNAKLRRPVLTNGGFAISGYKIELYVHEDQEQELTFGEALDVMPFALSNGNGYLVAGSYQYLIGDAPTSLDDAPPSAGKQGFVAKYSEGGTLTSRTTTAHEEISAIGDLRDGRYLVAGRYIAGNGNAELMVSRVRSWETTEGKSVNLPYVVNDSDFGDDELAGATFVPFFDGGKLCEVQRAVGIAVVGNGNYYAVAAALDCSGNARTGIAVLLADGALLQSFGSGGSKVIAGPGGTGVIPVGVERQGALINQFIAANTKNRWIWLGAAVGNQCEAVGLDCSFGLTRVDYITGSLHPSGWVTPAEQTFVDAARPRDMALDSLGRPVLAGVSRLSGGLRYVAVHRFKTDGTSDTAFAQQGWAMHAFLGHEAEAYGVRPRANGEIALAVLSYEPTNAGVDYSMGMLNLSNAGSMVWQHSPYAQNDLVTHTSIRTKLDYGNFFEKKVSSQPWAVAEDSKRRLVMVGFAGSDDLQNPCEKAANDLGLPQLNSGSQCGGPWSIALARYLPFGALDSRRWLAPKETRSIIVPSDVHLGTAPPSFMALQLHFNGFTALSINRAMLPFHNAVADPQTNSYGAYRFPFAPSVLKLNERFLVKGHPLDHHHRNSAGNRFAYDISIVRWTGNAWVVTSDDKSLEGNEKELVFGRPVRAVADGRVIACRRSSPDNPLGEIDDTDANFVTIEHNVEPFDQVQTERISYLHFRKGTVPQEVCPNICPADMPDCDVNWFGVDPDGATLPEPVDVVAGQLIGRAGNSGNSTSPHLHVHVNTKANEQGGPVAGNYPLLFHSVLLQSLDNGPNGATFPVQNRAILHGSLAVPTQ